MFSVYPIHPFGAEIRGFDLQSGLDTERVDLLKEELLRHRLLIVREQEKLDWEDLIRLGQYFGPLAVDENAYLNHPKAPSKFVGRLSNDPKEGATGVGTTGWHIDGSFLPNPFAISIYHIIHVPQTHGASTKFVGLKELAEKLCGEGREEWTSLKTVRRCRFWFQQRSHPLICLHPETHQYTACFHLGKTTKIQRMDPASQKLKTVSNARKMSILSAIDSAITPDIVYEHRWTPGDLLISDNLALAHVAGNDATLKPGDPSELRVLHRVNVAGKHKPISISQFPISVPPSSE